MSGVPKGNIHLKDAFDRLRELYEANDPQPPAPSPPQALDPDQPTDKERRIGEAQAYDEEMEAWESAGAPIWKDCVDHFLGALTSGDLVAYYHDDRTGNHLIILQDWWKGFFPEQHFLGNAISLNCDSLMDAEYRNYGGQTPFVDQKAFGKWLKKQSVSGLPAGVPPKNPDHIKWIKWAKQQVRNEPAILTRANTVTFLAKRFKNNFYPAQSAETIRAVLSRNRRLWRP